MLASRADPQSAEFQIRMKAEADGTATFEDIAVVLEDFRELYGTPAVDPEAGIDILCHMGLALPTERKDVYRFPALIQESRPETVWMKTQSVLPAEQHGIVVTCFLLLTALHSKSCVQAWSMLGFVSNVSQTLKSSLQLSCPYCRAK